MCHTSNLSVYCYFVELKWQSHIDSFIRTQSMWDLMSQCNDNWQQLNGINRNEEEEEIKGDNDDKTTENDQRWKMENWFCSNAHEKSFQIHFWQMIWEWILANRRQSNINQNWHIEYEHSWTMCNKNFTVHSFHAKNWAIKFIFELFIFSLYLW